MKSAPPSLHGFRNMNGEPLDLGSPSLRPRVKPPTKKAKAPVTTTGKPDAKQHCGFQACGFPPEVLAEAARVHEAKRQADARAGKGLTHPFNPAAWMNGNKPRNARAKPYSVRAAAEACADMLRSAGWQRVAVVEVLK